MRIVQNAEKNWTGHSQAQNEKESDTMGFVSRKYIREKWNSAKRDIEGYLSIHDENISDKIPEDEVKACIDNIQYQFKNILDELKKYDL